MIISIGNDFQPRVLEASDFGGFRVDNATGKPVGDIAAAVRSAVVFESEDVAWVSVKWLLSRCNEDAWRKNLGAMIDKARPHGWIRDAPDLAVRAHVRRAEAG